MRNFGPYEADLAFETPDASVPSDGLGAILNLDVAELGLVAAAIQVQSIVDASDEAEYRFTVEVGEDSGLSDGVEVARLVLSNRSGDLNARDGDRLYLPFDGETAARLHGGDPVYVGLRLTYGGSGGEDIDYFAWLTRVGH